MHGNRAVVFFLAEHFWRASSKLSFPTSAEGDAGRLPPSPCDHSMPDTHITRAPPPPPPLCPPDKSQILPSAHLSTPADQPPLTRTAVPSALHTEGSAVCPFSPPRGRLPQVGQVTPCDIRVAFLACVCRRSRAGIVGRRLVTNTHACDPTRLKPHHADESKLRDATLCKHVNMSIAY